MEKHHEPKIQIEMRSDVIVIRTDAYKGVLTETKFDGSDCFIKFLRHMKDVYNVNNLVTEITFMD